MSSRPPARRKYALRSGRFCEPDDLGVPGPLCVFPSRPPGPGPTLAEPRSPRRGTLARPCVYRVEALLREVLPARRCGAGGFLPPQSAGRDGPPAAEPSRFLGGLVQRTPALTWLQAGPQPSPLRACRRSGCLPGSARPCAPLTADVGRFQTPLPAGAPGRRLTAAPSQNRPWLQVTHP